MSNDTLNKALRILKPIRTVNLDDSSGQFESILNGLLSDLETPNTLSVLLCEQIAESVYWLRRHVDDKNEIMMEATALSVKSLQLGYGDDREFSSQDIARALSGDQALKDQIEKSIAKGNTLEGCRSRAFIKSAKEIRIADDLIQRQMLNIRHLQKGLDSIDLKKRILKRMDLEIKGIEDKLLAIEHDPKKD